MGYSSVDEIQKQLQKEVFAHTQSSKKAAGRALGTIVEIVTYYLLKSWNLDGNISIEKRIPEFGDSDITHNVEFSLHPIFSQKEIEIELDGKTITPLRILNSLSDKTVKENLDLIKKSNYLLKKGVVRNACTLGIGKDYHLVASI